MAPLTFYHLQDSRSFRVAWLLQELGVEHELKYSKRHGNLASPEFKAAHPMGKVPMLVLEDGETFIIESGAICEYLVETHASEEQRRKLMGDAEQDAVTRAKIRAWCYWAEATLMLHALPVTYSRWFMPEKYKHVLPEFEEALSKNINNDLKYLEESLSSSKSGFLYGNDLTLGDIMTAFSAQFVLVRGLGAKWSDDTYPHIKKWLKTLQGRPAWQAAKKMGEDSWNLDELTN